jgi:histidyl-tRNA synthetase
VIQAPRGTFDILPESTARSPVESAARRKVVEDEAEKILGAAGYGRIETPTFEATDLFARGVGEATDIVQKEMYTFDDGGGRSLTLRPEVTAPICRAYLEHGMRKLAQPVKLWYLSSCYRAEAPQRGRYREFWQVGAEAIGSEAPETDAELIVLLGELLEALGVRDTRLRLSSLGTPATRAEYREELKTFLRAHEGELSEDVRVRIDLNPMRAFDSGDRGTQAVMRNAPTLLDRLHADDAEHFEAVRALLDDAGLRYELDPTLVRGLDYYSRTVFEFTSDALGAQSGVGGGGRYDGLIELLEGPPTPASGWAAGVERMLLAARDIQPPTELVDLFVALAKRDGARTAFELALEARRAGLQAQLELTGRSLKGQLKHADRIGARYVAIVGDNGRATLKDMQSGEQHDTGLNDVIPEILRAGRLT